MCTGGRAGVRYVITKFYRMDSLPNFVTHGAPLRARFARARAPLSIIFFQCIYFRDVSLKNYLILYVKQKKNQCQGLKQRRGLKVSEAQLYQDFPLVHPPSPQPPPSKLSALICALLPLGRGMIFFL